MGIHQTKIGLASLEQIDWKGKKILDVGCGNGTLTLEVLKKMRCSEIVGIDVNEENGEKARGLRERKLKFFVSDASDLPFDGEVFDGIFCNIAFHWFEDKKKALEEMFRVLKNSGVVVLNYIEEKTDVMKRLDRLLAKDPFSRIMKVKKRRSIIFSEKEFDRLARATGFYEVNSVSRKDLVYYETVDSLVGGYKNTIEMKIKRLSPVLKNKVIADLKKDIATTRSRKGFRESWRIVSVRMMK